ncbi:MAG: hypothetical protein VW665_05555 [Candidatus Puniceispirillum sp.]
MAIWVATCNPLFAASPPDNAPSLEASYLAARQAGYLNDLPAAAAFYVAALDRDPRNPDLLQSSFVSQYMLGNIDIAAALARQMETLNLRISYASEPATAKAILAQDWDAVLVLSELMSETVSARPVASVIKAWALAAKGQAGAAIATIMQTGRSLVADQKPVSAIFIMQAAHLAEFSNKHAEKRQFMAMLMERNRLPVHITIQLAAMLHRDGNDRASLSQIGSLPDGFGRKQLQAFLVSADKANPILPQIAVGITDASMMISAHDGRRMLPARLGLALHIDPTLNAARFFLAQSFGQEEGSKQLVDEQLDTITDDSIWSQPRLLMQVDAERRINLKSGISRLDSALQDNPQNGLLHKEIGDLYRFDEQFTKSRDAYLMARKLGFDARGLDRSLAIVYERLDQDDLAEAHFLMAIKINPNDPFALNYLGYWWADEGRNLDQAIELIEKAVTLRPKSGFFVDSLGWVHFKRGNYDLAVSFLEKATLLEPSDPVITDHLGDAYWKVGRRNEARFKWAYALTIADDDDLKTKLRDKLAQ